MVRLTNEEILMKLTQLDRQVHEQLPGVLSLASFVLGRELSIHQFHAIIGAKKIYLPMSQLVNIHLLKHSKLNGQRR